MQNRLSLHLILRQIWLTPTVRTNRPTAKNTCQWSDHSCMRHLGVDQTLPSALLLSADTMCNQSRCMQWLPREFYDTSSLHRNSEFTTEGSHPTGDRIRPLSTLSDIPTWIGQETLQLASRSQDVCSAWDTLAPTKNSSCPD